MRRGWRLAAGAWLFAMLCTLPADSVVWAHTVPFSYLDIHIESSAVSGTLILHDFDVAHELGLTPDALLEPGVVAGKRAAPLRSVWPSAR